MSIAIRKKSELIGLMEVFRISKSNRDKDHSKQDSFVGKLLDTSAIIDGRIAEICSTGFWRDLFSYQYSSWKSCSLLRIHRIC